MRPYIAPLIQNVPDSRSDLVKPLKTKGKLILEGLTFQYSGASKLAVNNISYRIEPGSFIAIVGESGCGKTTLVKMLSGINKPSRGKIFLDDYDLQTLDRHVLKENLAIVQQDFKLLPGSLFDNIKGASEATQKEVWEAAKLACISVDIEKMPMGMHTVVSSNANAFSGGQIQRIAIARALVKKPKVIIFDESTSALDNMTQSQIIRNLNEISASLIFVAHRLQTIRFAQQILVMDKGNLVEIGSWEELMDKNGLFTKMVEISRVDSNA